MHIYFDAIKYDKSDCLLVSFPIGENDSYTDMICRALDLIDCAHIDSEEYFVKLSHGFND